MHILSRQVLKLLLFCGLAVPASLTAQSGSETFYSRTLGMSASGDAGYDCELDQFKVYSNSAQITGTEDSFQFVFENLTNDVDIKARVATNYASLAGLMIRSSEAGHASFALVGLSGGKTITRYRSGASQSVSDGNSMASSTWLRIRREANLISSYYSTNGTSWVLVESKTVNLGAQVHVGMAVANGLTTFANVSVIGVLENIEVVNPAPGEETPVETVPNSPSTLSASLASDNKSINLSWTDNSDNESGFRVQRQTGTGNFAAMSTLPAGSTSYQDNSITASTSFTYRVVAFNGVGNSGFTNSQQVTVPADVYPESPTDPVNPPASPPNRPTGIVAFSLSPTQIGLGWTDQSDNETNFVIERRMLGGGFLPIGLSAANVSSYLDISVDENTTYEYRVLAANDAGTSLPSNVVQVTVPSSSNGSGISTPDPIPTPDPVAPMDQVFTVNEIGNLVQGGTADYDSQNDMFRISASGGQIWGTKDDFHYVYRKVTGDVEATVKISSLQAEDAFGKAGIMFREFENETARHAFLTVSAGKGVALERRLEPDTGTIRSAKGNVSAPIWLRLIKEGTYLQAYYSEDGDNWNFLAEDLINFPETICIGLAVAASSSEDTVTADFGELKIVELNTAAATETFISADIGKVGVNGDAAYDPATDTFLIEASGGDIGHTKDAFHYVYREVNGNFDAVAKIESLVAEEDWAKTGLMVRESLLPDSPYFAIFMARNVGIVHQHRSSYGGQSDWAKVDGNTPFWVRISRTANVYRNYYSFDGSNWTLLYEATIELEDPVYLGMALTSHREGSLAYAEFSGVTVIN
ncbi:MAG: DUF1349 domain-containing protein [Verrucomicrobiae bacterium]|nr:DUF1349 domain-containing protein [Verrucomicrobiae bacterium]